jgi:acetylornithine deacetylase/succinyl-diaminopimelate desuccinylase-like protein
MYVPQSQISPLDTLKKLVACPSVSTDPSYEAGMEAAREVLVEKLTSMGLAVKCIRTPLHPIILAKREGDSNWPHVVVYGHYDVQPADPVELWKTPPFEPTVRDGRLYGRGAADNKGPLMVHISAIEQVLKENPNLPLRITMLIEGEEEIGSPSFLEFLQTHKDDLAGDFIFMSDTQSPTPDQLAITIGLRGLVALEIEMTGPNLDLHSGLHGGAIKNPIHALTELCASLHTGDGKVNIPGFYDDVADLKPWELDAFRQYKRDESQYLKFLGVPEFFLEPGYGPFEAIAFRPKLEINGIGGGYQGPGSKTIIPEKAFAKITVRLVPGQKAEKIAVLITETIKQRAPKGVRLNVKVHGAGDPYSIKPPFQGATPDLPNSMQRAFLALKSSAQKEFGHPPIFLREGGSVPIIALLKEVTGMDSLMLGLFNPDSNLHAPNENMNLAVFEKGLRVCAEVYRVIAR